MVAGELCYHWQHEQECRNLTFSPDKVCMQKISQIHKQLLHRMKDSMLPQFSIEVKYKKYKNIHNTVQSQCIYIYIKCKSINVINNVLLLKRMITGSCRDKGCQALAIIDFLFYSIVRQMLHQSSTVLYGSVLLNALLQCWLSWSDITAWYTGKDWELESFLWFPAWWITNSLKIINSIW